MVHFHALIRLDGPGEDYQPPQISVDAAGLAEVIRDAAARVRLTVEMPDNVRLVLRFGQQLDTQTVNGGPTGELTAEHAARYIAKYATKTPTISAWATGGLPRKRCLTSTSPTTSTGSSAPRGNSATTRLMTGYGDGCT